MSIEIIAELEDKVDHLIGSYSAARKEQEGLQARLDEVNGKMQELEEKNAELQQRIEQMGGASADQQAKLDAAAEKIKAIIGKLEAVN